MRTGINARKRRRRRSETNFSYFRRWPAQWQYETIGRFFCQWGCAGRTSIALSEIEVKGCLGCNACRYGKPCVQPDDFNRIVPKLKEADLVVFASPLYFWTISSKLKAFIERFYCIAQRDETPPYGRYEKYPVKDAALLMTSADDFFWTFEQAVSYYQFAIVNYIGFTDKGMLLAGGCGDTNGKPNIRSTAHLKSAYEFGKNIYHND